MKTLISIPLIFLLVLTSCKEQEARYSSTGPEIDLVKSVVADYEAGNWDSWLSHYADTAQIHHNIWEDASISPNELLEGFKQTLSTASTYSFDDEPIYFEKVITDDGKTWVNFWGNWRGTVKATQKEITIPVHLSIHVQDNKIQEEFAMYNLAQWNDELTKASLMTEDETKSMAGVNTITKAWNDFDTDLFISVTTENVVRKTNGIAEVNNQEDYKNFMTVFHTGFPDFKVTADNTVLKDNKAIVNWTVTGTHTGEFMGNDPTGKAIKTHGLSIWHFNEEGKATMEDAYYDNLQLYTQLGITSPSGS